MKSSIGQKYFNLFPLAANAIEKSENLTQFGQTLETVYLFICLFINTPWQPPTNLEKRKLSINTQTATTEVESVRVCVCVLAKSQLFGRYNSMTRKKGKQTG